MRSLIIFFAIAVLFSCNDETLPKPKGYLSLQYPENTYVKLPIKRPYTFEIPSDSKVKDLPKNWINIEYPKLKASIDITYRPVKNNLKELFMEAEKLVFEHTIKADQISSVNYANKKNKVYGKLFDITGNSASQVQFHVTDSTKHFLKASLFFNAKPNYDSILPAVAYIKKDMVRMMETLKWQ
ncbi:gliding motility lipoprotein GldD [Tenacibaculum sp. UWU-22]|uniref:gliding motility lipoprotein GldD n=1 Tax=Tenacibaculum sp. UWU-22 TaxID=3234187 RepID=UPI0034DB3B81